MPQNLPGFGAFHDNLSQHGSVAWTRVLGSTMVNTAAVTCLAWRCTGLRKQATPTTSCRELGIQGVGFGGKGAFGAPWFNAQGYSGMGDTYAATPMHAWDTIIEGRDQLSWQSWPPQSQNWRQLPEVHLADVGLLSKSRLLPVH